MYSKTYTLENGIRFDDQDVVNPQDYDPDAKGELDMPGCGNLPVLFHDHGFTLAIVFAETLQDAMDIFADSGKADRFEISHEEFKSGDWGTEENPRGIIHLGNESRMFDSESFEFVILQNPPFSFTGLYWEMERK